ncbi:MAG: trypsin-like serine protease [Pelagimonas sp.]|jgi:protease YdgD|nr:trypsin-like serine protease [Pelagimonas sp.]
MVRKTLGLVLGALLITALPTQAQDTRRIDQRSKLLGWEAVGKLETGTGYCTAALIARDIVLTAAHCVYRDNGQLIPASQIKFRPGYFDGAALETRGVTQIAAHESYRHSGTGQISGQNIANDLALLRLDAPIYAHGVNPFLIHQRYEPGKPVTLVSYGRGRDEALTHEKDCTLKQHYRDGVIAFDCSSTFGSSGAPVFVREDGRMRILSVVSAGGTGRDGTAETYGMTLPDRVAHLKKRLRTEAAGIKSNPGGKVVRVNRLGSATRQKVGSARFVSVPGS